MRIAFVSCLFTRVFSQQPVWDWIGQQRPDHLVLLGDSVYLDLKGPQDPRDMDDAAFAQHLLTLYQELLAQPQFAALVRSLPAWRVHTIWDDHDFLWNNACGAEVHPVHTVKLRCSTVLHEAFRRALSSGLGASRFPATLAAAHLQQPALASQAPLSAPSIALPENTWLHLSDGRTHRTRTWLLAESKRTLFGRAQCAAFSAAIGAAGSAGPPGAPPPVHLFASGSTLAGYARYERDWHWLTTLAAKHRMLVLSGDLHRNALDAFHTGGLPLHESTSSGAAVRDAVIVGASRQNHGLLDVTAHTVTTRLYKRNVLEQERVLDRSSWLPVASP